MAKKKKSKKVNKGMAVTVLALTVALAVLIVAMLALRNWKPGGNEAKQTDPVQTTGTTPQETTEPTQPKQTRPPIELENQIDGTYEQWLAAGVLKVLPLEYPDFADLEIYAAGETALENKQQSKGVYLKFTSGGATVILHAAPLEAERTEPNTREISTAQTGFATLDVVEAADFSKMQQMTLESISGHIDQVMLPSLYN